MVGMSGSSFQDYVYPRLLKCRSGRWFKIESEEDILEQINELLEAFRKTSFEEPLREPLEVYSCPACGEVELYEFYTELPTDYGLAHVWVEYCLNCKRAVVRRSRYVKLHFRRHGIVPVPENQTSLNVFLIEGGEAHAADRP